MFRLQDDLGLISHPPQQMTGGLALVSRWTRPACSRPWIVWPVPNCLWRSTSSRRRTRRWPLDDDVDQLLHLRYLHHSTSKSCAPLECGCGWWNMWNLEHDIAGKEHDIVWYFGTGWQDVLLEASATTSADAWSTNLPSWQWTGKGLGRPLQTTHHITTIAHIAPMSKGRLR